jgi:hypothetical protein
VSVAFDPTPAPESLSACHVPFEQLTGAALEVTVLREALGFAASDGSDLVGRGHVEAAAAG